MAFNDKLHTVVETTNLQATVWGRHIYNVVVDEDLNNGSFGYLGECVDETNDTYKLLKPTTDLIKNSKPVMIVHYDTKGLSHFPEGLDEEYYYNEAGKTVRAFEVENTGKFTMTSIGIDALDNTAGVQEGNYVVLEDGKYGLKEVSTKPTGVAFYGKIEKVGYYPMLYIAPNYIKDENNNLVFSRPTRVTIRVMKNAIA